MTPAGEFPGGESWDEDTTMTRTTITRFFQALALAVISALASAASEGLPLANDAPDRYIVLPGDTLWDLSAKFLAQPWRWPELWRMNRDQVRNPHRIYPGDVLVLERDATGTPRLRLQSARLRPRVHAEALPEEIPSIPPNVIRPFLSDPLIVDAGALDNAPRIVATQQDRVYLSRGDLAYVAHADPAVKQWVIYRNGNPLRDPDTNEIVAYEAFHLGTARQIQPGDPATFEVLTARQEVGRGERLVPATRPLLLAYVPRKPDAAVDGRVLSVYGGVDAAGPGAIVTINRGAADGLEIGHILALERNRVLTQRDENDRKETVVIPAERVGLLFVFRTFARVSYALIVKATGTIGVNDFVRTP